MTSLTEGHILKSLENVLDPATQKDLVTSGMVTGVVIKDGNVGFSIEVEPSRGAALEPMRKAAENAVASLKGVLSVTAVLTAHRSTNSQKQPKTQTQTNQDGTSTQTNRDLAPNVKHIVAVASGKGGVGKSTTAINLAISFASIGLSVGILDADIYGPSLPRMMGINEKPTSIDGKVLEPIEKYNIKCMSIGFLVPEDSPTIWRGPMVMSALEQMLRDVNWGSLDIMVVDMPPGTGDAQLTMSQRVPLAGAVIVSTPQDIALLDARKGLNMFRKVDVPVLGIIENMSMFICPNCGETSNIFGHGGAKQEANDLAVDFLGEVPLHMDIRETSDAGTPVALKSPVGEHAVIYKSIASTIWSKLIRNTNAEQKIAPRIVMS
ncbi:MAG: iron-sulfur cluster carrier protein ApbC [Rhodospirillaceae bacterium]|nr:iron-sulfur cluster carrier protein ApbC [Rhodospirillaceae bacterium]